MFLMFKAKFWLFPFILLTLTFTETEVTIMDLVWV